MVEQVLETDDESDNTGRGDKLSTKVMTQEIPRESSSDEEQDDYGGKAGPQMGREVGSSKFSTDGLLTQVAQIKRLSKEGQNDPHDQAGPQMGQVDQGARLLEEDPKANPVSKRASPFANVKPVGKRRK